MKLISQLGRFLLNIFEMLLKLFMYVLLNEEIKEHTKKFRKTVKNVPVTEFNKQFVTYILILHVCVCNYDVKTSEGYGGEDPVSEHSAWATNPVASGGTC